jgi:hypothetical protein
MNSPSEWRQFQLLSRDSVRKLLNAVVLGRDIDPTQFAIWMTAIVMTPPSLYSLGGMFKYAAMRRAPVEVIERVVMADRMFFMVYSMVAVALLAAMTWEALFPDRTDQEIIGSLPVRPRTLTAARLTASLAMAAGFALAINGPTALFFAFTAATNPALGFLPTVFVAHLLSTMAASLLVFLALLMVRGVVGFSLGAETADRLATVLQLAAIIAFFELFFYLPTVLPLLVRRMLEGPGATLWLPPAWFVAFYSWMVGSPRVVFAEQAMRGFMLLAGASALVVPIYLLPARIMARRALESQSRPRRGPLARLLRMTGRLAPDSIRRAVAEFAITSLARNRRHLLIVVSYAGVGIAIAAISLVAARLRVGLIAPAPTASLLAVPLVMMFFLTFGIRAAFRIPTDLDANWSFRVAPPTAVQAGAGTQLALFVLVVVPMTLLATIAALASGWSVATALTIAAFDVVTGTMLLEAALLGWVIVPFACGHEPSQETMKSRWLIYLIPLNIFAFRGASFQMAALGSTTATMTYLAVVLLILAGIRVARLRRARRDSITFDAPVDLRLEVLNLSEALH